MLKSWPGLIAVILAVISFYGTTYLVLALNTGWRFGYWLASATFGTLMVLISIFWIVNPVGPQGEGARWLPIGAARDRIAQATVEDKTLRSVGQYPGGPWQPAEEDAEQSDALSSAITACIATDPEKLPEEDAKTCATAQKLMPPVESIPIIDGSPVAVSPESADVRFTTESGALLGQVIVVPTTHDPRVAKDPIKGKPMGPPFRLLAVHDEGSLRVPPLMSLVIFSIYAAFHLIGLHRVEKKKLSPVSA